MVDIEFIGQLVDSMGDAIEQLEQAIVDKNDNKANKLRTFIFDLHRQVDYGVKDKNV